MKLRNIELVFENTDSIKIESEYIDRLSISDIVKSMKLRSEDNIIAFETAKFIAIKLKKTANIPRHEFNETALQIHDIFDRIKDYNDIVLVRLELGTPTDFYHRSYYADWARGAEDSNPYQKAVIDKNGCLCILINKTDEIKEIFDL